MLLPVCLWGCPARRARDGLCGGLVQGSAYYVLLVGVCATNCSGLSFFGGAIGVRLYPSDAEHVVSGVRRLIEMWGALLCVSLGFVLT